MRLKTLAFLWCAIGLVLGQTLFPLPIRAQGTITVVANEHEHIFQGPMTFHLAVKSDSEISDISLFYRPAGQTAAHKIELDFEPASSVEVQHSEEMNDPDNYVPPMVTFTYWWIIKDRAGNRLNTDQASFVYTDTRYEWDELEDERIRLYWHDQDPDFGQEYYELASQAATQLATEFGVQAANPVSLVIYNSHDELMSVLQKASAEWTGAVNFGQTGTIIIGLGASSWMKKVIPHELTHAMLEQTTQPPFGDIPRWLHEGLAMRSEGGMSAEESSALEQAVENDALISLRVLNSPFADQRDRAILSYAESNSLVNFIIDEYGTAKLGELIAIFAQGAHYDDAMTQVFGVDMDGMEDLWRVHIQASPRQGATQATPQTTPTQEAKPTYTVTPAPKSSTPTAGIQPDATRAPRSRSICLGAAPALALAALFALLRLRPV